MNKGQYINLKNIISRINFVREESSIEEKMQKEIFVFIYFIFSLFSIGCFLVLMSSGKERASLIPILYVLLAGICTYSISKNYFFRISQAIFTFCTILLPFLLQFYLGGIRITGVLMIWSSLSILNVISLKNNKIVILWCLAFLCLTIHSFVLEGQRFGTFENQFSKYFLGINFLIVAFIHFGLSRYVIFHQIRLSKKLLRHQRKLERTNDRLSHRNTEINDSMDYAEHLQRSILPKTEILSEKFQEIEIFFKPKEVIGGDFYWFGESEGKKIFAIIDCTGHGIPGAFVSMMGYNLLNHIVLSKKITYPGFILNQLNKMVKESLHQETSGNKDGMDISIISYDPISRNLEFSGAKNDLFYLDPREGLIRIKGSRYSIGGFNGSGKTEYDTHSITVREKTKFFMTTDGLIDQFGGEKNKRFSTKRLQNFLRLMQDKNVDNINKDLVNIIEDWKGENEQIDDILFSVFSIDPQKDINRVLKIKRYDKKEKRA